MTTQTVQAPGTTRARRLVEGTAFVGVWIALGYLLGADANVYLLLGIPLTVAFQLLVRRRPLRELWVRDGERRFHLDRAGIALAVLLAVVPVVTLVQATGAGSWPLGLWAVAAIAGAVPAAWTFRRSRFVTTVLYTLPTVVIGGALLAVLSLAVPGGPTDLGAAVGLGLFSVLQYIPAVFVLEEVAFRGALDTHAQRPGERGGIATALFFSAVWGAWHLPIQSAPGIPLWMNLVQVVLVSVVLGLPITYAWRRTGTLAAPGLGHAIYNGMRNAVLS